VICAPGELAWISSMRMREARTKFIHQLSCGWAFHFSQTHSETPPVRMTNSPLAAGATGSAARTGASEVSKTVSRSSRERRMGGENARLSRDGKAENAGLGSR
jgi:hypothetical protein